MRTRSSRRTSFTAPLALLLVTTLFVLGPDRLAAQDFAFHDVGARAASLGGAFVAQADDLTAVYYNPAGLAFLDGLRVKTSLGFSTRELTAAAAGEPRTYRTAPHEMLGNFFLSWRPVKGIVVGAGFYTPYNFDSIWPSSWAGDRLSIAAKLQTRTFRPVLAIEPVKGLALAAAVDFVSTGVRWDLRWPFELANYELPHEVLVMSRHESKGHGTGFAAGALWKVFSGLQVGARYQKSAAVALEGRNTFVFPDTLRYSADFVPDPYAPYISVLQLLDKYYWPQETTSRMTMPREIAGGVLIRPFRRLSLNLEAEWDKWSEFGAWEFTSVDAGGTLAPEFTPVYEEFYGISPDYGVQGVDLALRDSRKLKAGLEYLLGRWFAVRGGYARHESSVETAGRTPLYPDPAFSVFSFGAGYEGPLYSIWDEEKAVSRLSIEFFVRYAVADEAVSGLEGLELAYGARRWVAGVGVGFIF